MSQWTHINAVIRFDAIRVMGQTLPDLGYTCSYESETEDWDKCNVPCGSEGSMQYQVWEDKGGSGSIAAYTVMFWGDLRDYSDSNAILHYFNKITKGQMIRSGLLEIDIEGSQPIILRYNENEWGQISPLGNN